jgi:hypothetical protein
MIRKASITDDTYEPYGLNTVDTRFDVVDTRLNSIFEWKLHTTVTGNNIVSLPESYNEILLISKATSSSVSKQYDCFSYHLTKQEIDIYLNGKTSDDYSKFYCISDSSNVLATWCISGDKNVNLVVMKCGSTTNMVTYASTYTYIYYR